MMNSVGMSPSFDGTSNVNIGKECGKSEELHTYDSKPLSKMSDDTVNRENFRDENEEPAIMDSISTFLETMHSKNLTLKKLAKVQQQRIDELSRENKALRRASEMKDEEILQLRTNLNSSRNVPAHTDHTEKDEIQEINQKKSPAKTSIPRGRDRSESKSSAAASNGNEQTSQASAGQRSKPSIIVSHKVAVKRVMRLVRKINGTYNRKSVGLYTFVRGFAHVVLPLLVSTSRDTPIVLYLYYPLDKSDVQAPQRNNSMRRVRAILFHGFSSNHLMTDTSEVIRWLDINLDKAELSVGDQKP